MCLYPKLIENPKYRANKKNKGNVPKLKDNRVKLVPIGCGKCIECTKRVGRSWQVRLFEEIRQRKDGKFVTLTFDNESLIKLSNEGIGKGLGGYDLDNECARIAVRRFLERWRKKNKKSVRHWLVTELGTKGSERLHLHGLIFTDRKEEIAKHWQYGHVFIGGFVTEKSVNYIIKYLWKKDEKHKEYKPKIFTSPGIGKGYLKRKDSERHEFNGSDTIEYYMTRSRHKINLPMYYRNHLFSEEQREKLWIHKLDEQVRYVNGFKIDISKGEEVYYNALEMARKKNRELKFGDDTINWDLRLYERQRRRLLKLEKIYKVSPTG